MLSKFKAWNIPFNLFHKALISKDTKMDMTHMTLDRLVHTILSQIEQPKKDLEHNLHALLSEAIQKMDLVTQEELDQNKHQLQQAQKKINDLNQQIKALEDIIDPK